MDETYIDALYSNYGASLNGSKEEFYGAMKDPEYQKAFYNTYRESY